jgi:hypothetical protein
LAERFDGADARSGERPDEHCHSRCNEHETGEQYDNHAGFLLIP